ncbi:GlcNAc transferase [Perkinsela sp. CCAP 1560/4]|nr:GlcNAc transferase [Perkinsela sp. CCAP 1560/4]KNH06655.1 GlcNAc transferase [Perkinsela sp. CCAP 1560/4]|eukprot:KNH04650.1 GlcNAc transferase [Perkinsela sp. CCAP 1560/4]
MNAKKKTSPLHYTCILLPIALGIAFYFFNLDKEQNGFENALSDMENIHREDQRPDVFSTKESGTAKQSIFVSFSSYYNQDCSQILENIYKTASKPENVFVGMIAFIADPQKEDCMPRSWTSVCQNEMQFCPRANVRVHTPTKAIYSGPSDAHHMSRDLYRGEKYTLLIHDNTSFVRGWDDVLIERYDRASQIAKHDQVVLSHPLPRWLMYTQQEMDISDEVRSWNRAKLNDFDYFDIYDEHLSADNGPFEHCYASDSFLFAPSELLQMVPRDPNIQFLLHGGDLLYSARIWTSGWDIYHPGKSIAFRKCPYREAKSWSYVDRSWKALRKSSINRLQRILARNKTVFPIHDEQEKLYMGLLTTRHIAWYSTGTQRSLESYWEKLRVKILVEDPSDKGN